MELAADICYRALQARDARFDGVFFTGVRTTGIFCRPICSARLPKPASCRFFQTAAEAMRENFRPCLLCRPETAPGHADQHDLPGALFRLIQERAISDTDLGQIAAQSGFSERQLRRMMQEKFGVSPVGLLQTHRLLFAKKLLQETRLPMLEVAQASGFGSLRRFNALFRARCGLTPSQVRQLGLSAARPVSGTLELRLDYRPPLAWAALLDFLRKRAIPGVEKISGDRSYARTIALGGHQGWVSVRQEKKSPRLLVTLPAPLAAVSFAVLQRLRRLFDLDAQPAAIHAHLHHDPLLQKSVERQPGLRVPGAWDRFEVAWRAVLGQQISVAGATTLSGRLVARWGQPLVTPIEGLSRLSPSAETLAAVDASELAQIGLPGRRAALLVHLAQKAAAGFLDFPPAQSPDETIAALLQLPGVGPWTAHYLVMRALHYPDAFPSGDLALRQAAGGISSTELERRAESWRPWRAYAALHLWHSLSLQPCTCSTPNIPPRSDR